MKLTKDPTSTLPSQSKEGKGGAVLQVAALVSLVLVALPIFYLAKRALESDFPTLKLILFRAKTLEILLTTLTLALSVAILATTLGFAIALTLHLLKLPRANLLRALTILPVAIPSYVFTYCWLSLDLLPGGLLPAILILSLSTTPYVVLAALASLRRVDSSQIDVAQTLGLNRIEILRKVILPQVRIALSAGALLVTLYVLSDFGAVSLLGVDTFTRAIQNTYQGSFDRSIAAVLALMLVIVAALVISLETSSRKRAQMVKSSVTITKAPELLNSFRLKVSGLLLIVGYIFFALLAPLTVLIFRFISRPEAVDYLALVKSAASSTLVALIGALIALLLAMPIAILSIKGSKVGSFAERGVLLVNALPGIVVGLALVAFGSDLPFIYQTLALLALAYSILFLARSVGTIRSSLLKVPANLTEIAATLGQSGSQVFWRITAPLAAPGILTGMLLVFLSAMKELPATLMLRPIGFETLATEIWNKTTIFRFSEAAPYALTLVLIAALPTFLISRPDRQIDAPDRGDLQ